MKDSAESAIITFVAAVVILGTFLLGARVGENVATKHFVDRLKSAGLAYYDKNTGELIIDLPDVNHKE